MALIVCLIDGMGLAPPDPSNLVARGLPLLAARLGAPLTDQIHIVTPMLLARPIDATLGVPGLPQSGSGHSAIWGGFNAAASNGRHQPSYPTIAMRERLRTDSLLHAAQCSGSRVAWANGYLPGYAWATDGRRVRHTAGTWAAIGAGVEQRGLAALLAGTALTWDVTQQLARTRREAADLPLITPQAAGARLAALARSYDLVAYETYLPDLAAHERLPIGVDEALAIMDGLIDGAAHQLAPHDTLILTSDHGNSEDAGSRTHTRNPVPLIAIGPAAPCFADVTAIDQIAAAVLQALAMGDT